MMRFLFGIGRTRLLTHAVLAILSFGALEATKAFYAPHGGLEYIATIGFGYWSLILMIAGLLIGPLNLLRKRRNPVNIDLRRDVGIWAGITALVHVIFGFTLHMQGNILLYFFRQGDTGYRLQLNLFGVSNDIGLIATLVLVALLVTSNDWALRVLKGPRWKNLQRLNYGLFALVVLHTAGYQAVSRREAPFGAALFILVTVTLAGQLVGVAMMRERKQRPRRVV